MGEWDPVIGDGLPPLIKYVPLPRWTIWGRRRFFAQVMCEGLPMQNLDPETEQVKYPLGSETLALGIGLLTIAVVGDNQGRVKLDPRTSSEFQNHTWQTVAGAGLPTIDASRAKDYPMMTIRK